MPRFLRLPRTCSCRTCQDALKACLQRYENLVAYTHRMMALYYAEFLA